MLAIADICDDLGVCYPGIKRIAERACLSERYTQKIIRQLEEAGDLKVEISNGILTTHGMTNRYYMVKFRQSIGLDTGELSDTPLEQGVNHRTPQGVNHRTPKLSVELSEELPVVDPPIVDLDIAMVMQSYETWFGLLTSGIVDELKESTRLYGSKWICEALEESAKNNVRKWKYAKAILERWKTQGRSNTEQSEVRQVAQSELEKALLKSASETGLMYAELMGGMDDKPEAA
jgi:DnaD/phage-associated family protein